MNKKTRMKMNKELDAVLSRYGVTNCLIVECLTDPIFSQHISFYRDEKDKKRVSKRNNLTNDVTDQQEVGG